MQSAAETILRLTRLFVNNEEERIRNEEVTV